MQRIKCRVEELREYVDTIWHVALAPQQELGVEAEIARAKPFERARADPHPRRDCGYGGVFTRH